MNRPIQTLFEGDGFFTARGRHSAPNAVLGSAASILRVDEIYVADVDRVGNEVDGTVHHAGVDAAAMRATSRDEEDGVGARLPFLDIRTRATDGVRWENSAEVRIRAARVAPSEPLSRIGTFRISGKHAVGGTESETGTRRLVIHTALMNDTRRNVFVRFGIAVGGVDGRDDFRERQRVARTVLGGGQNCFAGNETVDEETSTFLVRGVLHGVAARSRAGRGIADATRIIIASHRIYRRIRITVRRADERGKMRGARVVARRRMIVIREQVVVARAVEFRDDFLVDRGLFEIGEKQNVNGKTIKRVSMIVVVNYVRILSAREHFVSELVRNASVGALKVEGGESELLEVVGALHTPRRFARRLNCRKEQADQNTDNGNDDEKLHERKTVLSILFHGSTLRIL